MKPHVALPVGRGGEVLDDVGRRADGDLHELDQCWKLSRAWYEGRLDLDYERRPLDQSQALLRAVGLTGDAWSLTPTGV